MNKKITQYDVAKRIGVSTATVSRVLNKDPHVDQVTRHKVLEAIERLGYIPNQTARSLASGRNNSILLLILDKEPIFPSTWQYELPVLQEINRHMQEKQYTLQIEMVNGRDSFMMDRVQEELIKNRSVDGLIILTSWPLEDTFIQKIDRYRIPAVFIGNGPHTLVNHQIGSTILFDNAGVIKETYALLQNLGHRNIAFIKGDEIQLHAVIRFRSFCEAITAQGGHLDERYIFDGHYSVQGGYQALNNFVRCSPPPSAIICANDLIAIGVMKAAADLGIHIPEELSVIGFDNIEISGYLSPPLTTVNVPTYEMGLTAAVKLINQIELGEKADVTLLPVSLVHRGTVAPFSGQPGPNKD
ncbi:MAG: LacI family transcriptional regulator [Spirochaetaceae bacterium]|jgi:DNA-binding LacI/PurR family transcriptional regulator|nr:LacI family transcriptional regulator [Spirochaetaceae bacterium]